MKHLTLILISLVFLTSCGNKKVEELNKRISELENQNTKLINSLNNSKYLRVLSSDLIGIPHKNNLTTNQANKFTFLFSSIQKLPKYNVYQITKNGNEELRELLFENLTDSRFEYNFIPKSNKDKSFELLAEFDLDSIRVDIPSSIDMSLNE